MTLPQHVKATGTLPPGRYRTTLSELEDRYVHHPMFSGSKTRSRNWEGFRTYREAWSLAEGALGLGQRLVQAYWLGGSFISDAPEPDDIDVTVVVDGDLLQAHAGSNGMGEVKKLYRNRTAIRSALHVEPFVLRVKWEASTLLAERLPESSRVPLARRGGLDNFWQRLRPVGPKDQPVAQQTVFAERGYVEVAP